MFKTTTTTKRAATVLFYLLAFALTLPADSHMESPFMHRADDRKHVVHVAR
jgi:hypothetical protein